MKNGNVGRLFAISVAFAGLSLVAGCGGGPSLGSGAHPGLVKPEYSRALTSAEQAVTDKQGLVLGPAGSAPSYHLGYTALFKAHERPYFTADAILHAVHRCSAIFAP